MDWFSWACWALIAGFAIACTFIVADSRRTPKTPDTLAALRRVCEQPRSAPPASGRTRP